MTATFEAPSDMGMKGPSLTTWLIAATVVVALVWSALAWVDEIVRAPGQIVPSSRPQIIQNLEGGILAELDVAEGDVVEAGQTLARLQGTQYQAVVDELSDQIAALGSDQIAALQTEHIAGLGTAQITALSTAQTHSYTPLPVCAVLAGRRGWPCCRISVCDPSATSNNAASAASSIRVSPKSVKKRTQAATSSTAQVSRRIPIIAMPELPQECGGRHGQGGDAAG